MRVRFWEARVADGRLSDALTWVNAKVTAPAHAAGAHQVEVFVSEADAPTDNPARVVVLTRWGHESDWTDPDISTDAIERAHGWDFHIHE